MKGVPSAWGIAKLFEIYKGTFEVIEPYYLSQEGKFQRLKDICIPFLILSGDSTIFQIIVGLQMMLVSYSIKISPTFNQRARIIFPMTLHTRLVHLGSSSFTVEDVLKDDEKDDVLITVIAMFIIMSQKTRRSEPFKSQTSCKSLNLLSGPIEFVYICLGWFSTLTGLVLLTLP